MGTGRKVFAFSLFLIVILILLAGCDPVPDPVPTPPPCGPASLIEPELGYPVDMVISEIEPTLIWGYGACTPDSFSIRLVRRLHGVVQMGSVSGLENEWTVDSPLLTGGEYSWQVAAVIDGTEGPWSRPGAPFWIGPVCDLEGMVAPIPLSPEDLSTVTIPHQAYTWEWTGVCSPDFYETELTLASDRLFSLPNMFDNPTDGPPRMGKIPRELLVDCEAYIWRVRAVSGGVPGPWSDVFTYRTDFAGTCSACPTDYFVQPIQTAPSFNEIITVYPPVTVDWMYPDYCWPDTFKVEVGVDGDFDTSPIVMTAPGIARSWDITDPLLLTTRYEVRITPQNGTLDGPASVDKPFWTGPICSLADLVAPDLLEPANGAEVTNPSEIFHWDTPGPCLPQYYTYQLSEYSDFSVLKEDFALPVHSTRIFFSADDPDPMTDCTIYFWRVWGRLDGGDGPVSDVFNFYTNFEGICLPLDPHSDKSDTCNANQFYDEDSDRCLRICSTITRSAECDAMDHCKFDTPSKSCVEK